MARLQGANGKLASIAFGTEIDSTGALADEAFHRITAAASSGSGLPSALEVNDIFYNKPAISLATGDKVKKLTITDMCFVTDVGVSASKETYENTTQCDDYDSFVEAAIASKELSIGGYYESDSAAQEEIENHFETIIKDDGAGVVTKDTISTETLWLMLKRRETAVVGETEIVEFLPLVCESLTKDKPMRGVQPFSASVKAKGEEHPCTYKRTISS